MMIMTIDLFPRQIDIVFPLHQHERRNEVRPSRLFMLLVGH